MQYGSLEWANDLLNHTKAELEKINNADEKGKAAAAELGITEYYTNLIKALEDEVAKGQYVPEAEMPAKDTSDDEDFDDEEIYDEAKNQWDAMSLNAQDYLVNNPSKVDDVIAQLGVSENVAKAMKDIFNDKLEDIEKHKAESTADDDVTQNLIKGMRFGQYDK